MITVIGLDWHELFSSTHTHTLAHAFKQINISSRQWTSCVCAKKKHELISFVYACWFSRQAITSCRNDIEHLLWLDRDKTFFLLLRVLHVQDDHVQLLRCFQESVLRREIRVGSSQSSDRSANLTLEGLMLTLIELNSLFSLSSSFCETVGLGKLAFIFSILLRMKDIGVRTCATSFLIEIDRIEEKERIISSCLCFFTADRTRTC